MIWILLLPLLSRQRLKLLTTVFRHGARSPIRNFPSDPNNGHWINGSGQLTNKGIQMMYDLGQFVRRNYPFLGAYRHEEVRALSSDIDRTIMSLLSFLAGLYPSDRDLEEIPGDWMPIPVHTIPAQLDRIFEMSAPCPAYHKLIEQLHPAVEEINKKYEKLISRISKLAGFSHLEFPKFNLIYSGLVCDRFEGLELPPWVNETVLGEMQLLEDMEIVLFHTGRRIRRLYGGHLLGEITRSMRLRREGHSSAKLMVYSGHDSTLLSLLWALGVNPVVNPPFGSAVFLELHEEGPFWYVRIVYRAGPGSRVLTIPGCSPWCELGRFEALLREVIPDDIERECGLSFY